LHYPSLVQLTSRTYAESIGNITREVKQRTLDAWYGRLDAHEREERDPEWSFETSTAFEQDLTVLSDRNDL
jgi:hypothetical protein